MLANPDYRHEIARTLMQDRPGLAHDTRAVRIPVGAVQRTRHRFRRSRHAAGLSGARPGPRNFWFYCVNRRTTPVMLSAPNPLSIARWKTLRAAAIVGTAWGEPAATTV